MNRLLRSQGVSKICVSFTDKYIFYQDFIDFLVGTCNSVQFACSDFHCNFIQDRLKRIDILFMNMSGSSPVFECFHCCERNSFYTFICCRCSWYFVVWRPSKAAPYIIHSAVFILSSKRFLRNKKYDGDVPRRPSYGVFISQLFHFARTSSHVSDLCLEC